MTRTAPAYPRCSRVTTPAATPPHSTPTTRAPPSPETSYPAPRPRVQARRTSPRPSPPRRRYQPSGRCRSARQVPLPQWGPTIRASGHLPGAQTPQAPAAPTRGPPPTSSHQHTMVPTTAPAPLATTTGRALTGRYPRAGRRRTRDPRASSS